MIKNYFKIIFRNLGKYKGYTFINLVGLAIGIAALVWGFQMCRYSKSFDGFHKDRDHVFRALIFKKGAEGPRGIFPMPAVQLAKHDFAGINAAVRYTGSPVNVRYRTNETFAELVYFTDTAFFDLFNFPLAAGNYALDDPGAVMITESVAKKYFGNAEAIGKPLVLYADENYSEVLTVRGVLKDVPKNSALQFGIITNFGNLLTGDSTRVKPDDWNMFVDAAFFYIPNTRDVANLEQEMAKYLPLQNKAREDAKVAGFKLISIRENAGLRDVIGDNNLAERPNDAATYGPLVLAMLIFLSACLNFSNTTVAHASSRLKEIGIRKVMGSTFPQLMGQLLSECALIVTAAILLSMLMNAFWLPAFGSMFQGLEIHANYLGDGKLVFFLFCILLFTTFLAGAYPAFYLSRFSPNSIFRGSVKFGGSNLFSKIMLGLQLSISIITVTAGISFARNAAFQRHFDYGYNIESNMGITLNDTTTYTAMKNELYSMPGVVSFSGTHDHIGFGRRHAVAESAGAKWEVDFLEIGREYAKTMGLTVVAGRGFDANMQSDYADALLISEKMAAAMGWKPEQAVGKRIFLDSSYYSVVGVVKDFHAGNLFQPLQPVAMRLGNENQYKFLIIQTKPEELGNVYQRVKASWEKLYPTKPFNGFYQNMLKAEVYQSSVSISRVFLWFGVISILLTATGLFALVSLTTLKKMKEIALRKVVGANPGHIMILINRGYFWIFIGASLVGCLVGWMLTRLLLDLIFKINVGVSPASWLGSVIVLFVIAATVSGIKVRQAIKTSPTKLLRAE